MARTKKEDDSRDILEKINAEFGDGTIVSMVAAPERQYTPISTGCLALDYATGIGGFPRGRIVEVYGPESSGKTTIALQTLASAMRDGHRCAFVDAEHALDVTYAQALGVDLSKLAVSQPDYGEQALDIVDRLVHSEKFAVVVVDSVAALTPKVELDGEMSDLQVGAQARMMGKACRKLVAAANVTDTLLVFINQTRQKIGVTYGSPETTPGGNALRFYASMRVKISRIGSNKSGEDVISNKTLAKVIKNKCAPPFKEAAFEIEFGKGTNIYSEVLDMGIAAKKVIVSGAWYSLADGTRLGQGREKAKQCLADNQTMFEALLTAVRPQ